MILLIDNYDSFVYNLARYFEQLGQQTLVVRNDAVTVDEVRRRRPVAIVLSPGPGTPRDAGVSLDLVRSLHEEMPALGVCLGHQTIAAALGGSIVRAPVPMHGRTSPVEHDARGLFADCDNPLEVCRYHSLAVDAETLPHSLRISARTSDGVVMGIAHRERPVFGVQFHPEAILTQCGYRLLSNFLRLAGLPVQHPLPSVENQLHDRPPRRTPLPTVPVTF